MTASLPVVFVLPLAGALALWAGSVVNDPRFSVSAAFTVLAALVLVVFVALARKRYPRAGIAAACHAVAWAPFMVGCAWKALDAAIVHGDRLGCGTGQMAFAMIFTPFFAGFFMFVGLGAGVRFAREGTDRVIRTLAITTTSLTVLASAFALAHSGRPDPDGYLSSLETVGEIGVESDVTLAGRTFHYVRANSEWPPVRATDPPESALATTMLAECRLHGLDPMQTFYPGEGPCPRLRVRVDRGAGLAIVDAIGPAAASSPVAFRPSNGATLTVTAASLAGRIAPPVGWTAGAGLGATMALGLLFGARSLRRRAAAIAGWEALHTGDGRVILANGDELRADVAAHLPVGPVVLACPKESAATYRTTGTPTFGVARAGSLAQLRRASTDLASSLDGIALAAALLGGIPLFVARLFGVL